MRPEGAYREAEAIIDKARRSAAEEVDLRGIGLVEVPPSLAALTRMRGLYLGGNRLAALPEWLGRLKQLQLLNLERNQLTALPEWLGRLRQLEVLDLSRNRLTTLPEWLGGLGRLQWLTVGGNQLTALPESLGGLTQLRGLDLGFNQLTALPEWLGSLTQLQEIYLGGNQLTTLPRWLGWLTKLQNLHLRGNRLTTLPESVAELSSLRALNLERNPLDPELAAAHKEGLDAVKRYLRAKAKSEMVLNEAKLILVGEGEVGKSCLLGALRGDTWEEGRPTTHGVEIKPFKVTDEAGSVITLNGWDFGGQRVYRPTHQLFFSAPAVYLVVWKPREGPQQGFVREWIRLVTHREPAAKILVVATHGGPGQRQPDIDRQELWDLFGKETVIDFLHVESKPDKNGKRRGIAELKEAIACVAAGLPEMGRKVPKSWQEAREALQKTGAAYMPLNMVLKLCRKHKMDDDEARLFVTISHRLGHLIHYQHDPALRDIVVLKPDWLATAISYVLDDEETRKGHGLVTFARLGRLWNDPERKEGLKYPAELHPVFLRLMERFDLSYRVAGPSVEGQGDETSLIAQLVPDNRPDPIPGWIDGAARCDAQQVQICCIVDAQNGQSAAAEGLFYQLIVRLHKYSLGRANHEDSVHWQRGLVLDDDYNGRALMEHVGNDVRITVRAPYPERFLAVLTSEVKWLVENFWAGLRCDVMVPCVAPCGRDAPGTGLYKVKDLIDSKRENHPQFPCPVCNKWQDIDSLLRNAPAARPIVAEELLAEYAAVRGDLVAVRQILMQHDEKTVGRFDRLDINTQRILSKVDAAFTGLMQALTDEAKDGPRLFSLVPVDRTAFNPRQWTSAKWRLTLWCEHSRLPLPEVPPVDPGDEDAKTRGVYELELNRGWFRKAAPFIKVVTGTLGLMLPVASSAVKLALDDATYKRIEEELDFGRTCIDAALKGAEKAGEWLGGKDAVALEQGLAVSAHGATLRELHALLKEKDPGFGGLVRVQNKRQEFLWVHPRFEGEY